MKKIMFNDRFGLTDAVLEGRKTVTRRIVPEKILYEYANYEDWCLSVGISECGTVERQYDSLEEFIIGDRWLPYQVVEIVAIAQKYKDIIDYSHYSDKEIESISKSAGWNNKMFVLSHLMPNQIEILDVRVERLQDITDEDCIKEGISSYDTSGRNYIETIYGIDMINKFIELGKTHREAFASLIDKVGKKGTWDSNPYVFRYEFKKLK